VLDTGIYYYHPAFVNSFMTIEEMRSRGVDVREEDGINGMFYGRHFSLVDIIAH